MNPASAVDERGCAGTPAVAFGAELCIAPWSHLASYSSIKLIEIHWWKEPYQS